MSRFKTLLRAVLLGFALAGPAFAEAPNAEIGNATPPQPVQEERVALVIGNSNYQTAPKLANPSNDAQSMAQMLNSAGFEVTEATDLTRSDMIKVVQDFTTKVAARGPKAVAMIYYAGHGVQVAGENYLLPVDANIFTPADLPGNSLRLVDLMGTLETIPSRMRIVVLDACRNNPFPGVNDKSSGLAIVDAPNGSIVGYSTAPGMEAQDGDGNHSPYTSAFLRRAREPNLPIEQLFKRVRLDVNDATEGRQKAFLKGCLPSLSRGGGHRADHCGPRAAYPGGGKARTDHLLLGYRKVFQLLGAARSTHADDLAERLSIGHERHHPGRGWLSRQVHRGCDRGLLERAHGPG